MPQDYIPRSNTQAQTWMNQVRARAPFTPVNRQQWMDKLRAPKQPTPGRNIADRFVSGRPPGLPKMQPVGMPTSQEGKRPFMPTINRPDTTQTAPTLAQRFWNTMTAGTGMSRPNWLDNAVANVEPPAEPGPPGEIPDYIPSDVLMHWGDAARNYFTGLGSFPDDEAYYSPFASSYGGGWGWGGWGGGGGGQKTPDWLLNLTNWQID